MKPKISVVVPTYNRQASLGKLLNSLYVQSIPQQDYEVIVINDGSTDGTHQYLKQFELSHQNLTTINQNNKGPAAARNTGIKKAEADYIAFTDDDCLATENWLESILTTFNSKDVIGIQGKTSTYSEQKSPLTHQIENLNGSNALPTCNAAFKKEALLKIGGFDEAFPNPHNEDADLAWRLQEVGPLTFEPSVHIIHPPLKVPLKKLAKRMLILKNEFLLYYKNPSKYITHRNSSPWKTIYGEVFCKHMPLHLKSRFSFIHRPKLFITGVALNIVWWFSLIIYFPVYLKANRYYKLKYKNNDEYKYKLTMEN